MAFVLEQKIKNSDAIFMRQKYSKYSLSSSHSYLKVKELYIPFEDIIMIHALSNYSFIYTASMGKIMTSKTLKYWNSKIEDTTFLRVHASYLINRKYILAVNKKLKCVMMHKELTAKISRQIKLKTLFQMEHFI